MNAVHNIDVDLEDLAAAVTGGQRPAVATALNLLDDARPAERERARTLMSKLPEFSRNHASHLVGLTGPPGTGKSTLTSALIRVWRARGLTVGILAVGWFVVGLSIGWSVKGERDDAKGGQMAGATAAPRED